MYISQVNFQIPSGLVKLVDSLEPISFSLVDKKARNPIYRQLNQLIISNQHIQDQIQLHDSDHDETLTVTPELLEKLRSRYRTIVNEWNVEYTPFREQQVPEFVKTQVKSFLPKQLQQLNPQVAIQSKSDKQGIIPPHKDHYRTASLFLLLQSNDEATMWWEPTDSFEEFDFFRFADVTKIKPVHTEIIKKNKWYVFNNSAYHSVHSTGVNGKRTALCIEFDTVSASDLHNIINNHGH